MSSGSVARPGRKKVITTRPDTASPRAPDLVQRQFRATGPNQLWVTDFTYVPTWSGFVFTAFVVDVFSRRIVGWRTAASMTTPLVMDALEMAIFSRRHQFIDGLIAHSDAGSQYVSIAYTERLAEIGARPSIGSIGDSYDNALAETMNGLYKTEPIRRRGPWRTPNTSNSRHSLGSRGSATVASTASSATSHPPSSNPVARRRHRLRAGPRQEAMVLIVMR